MKHLNIIIITGLSGSGKSTAIDALEDVGYFCVDNLPVVLLPKFLELHMGGASEIQKLALGMDLRQKEFVEESQKIFADLRKAGFQLRILFLTASEEALIRRFSQTRRQHPIHREGSLRESIRFESEKLEGLKTIANEIIDTTGCTVHQLKKDIIQWANQGRETNRMQINILSFGFKYGVPLESDFLLDVRFVPNPYFIPELKALDGKDERVRQFVNKWSETQRFLGKISELLNFLIPLYEKEGKAYLTIAVGCTGGRHRSVTIAQEIFAHLKDLGRPMTVTDRDLEIT
jgi:UPF0042 nucleotide-binding protein